MAEVVNTAWAVAEIVYNRVLQIKQENGYETNMGATVFQGKTRVADDQVLDAKSCLSVIEGIDVVEAQAGRGRIPLVKLEQRFGLVGYAECDPSAPNIVAHKMLRDMKRAIWHDGANFGGAVLEVKYLSRDIGPRADGVNIVMALIEFGVQYAEDLTKP